MNNNETSRWVVIDLVELIKEDLAIYSHLQELYKEVNDELNNAERNWLWQEEINALQSKGIVLWGELKEIYKQRQNAMQELKKLAVNYDKEMWCLVKHSIKMWWMAEEVWNTDMNNIDYENLMIGAEDYMYRVLSRFLWTEIVTCWRCLLDEMRKSDAMLDLAENKNKNEQEHIWDITWEVWWVN